MRNSFAINNKNFNYRAKKNNSTFNILFVGGLDKAHYFKGVDILLKAVAKVKLKKEWKLNIVGKGELKTYYQEQAQKLNIADKVYFNDNISNQELPEFYKQADLFILPSINNNEAFGIVLIEAMACGTPVIASNLVGVRTVFDNNEQGLFFEPQNHLELKEKIEKILNNDELKKSMEKKCLELVKQKYSLDVIKKKIKKVFI